MGNFLKKYALGIFLLILGILVLLNNLIFKAFYLKTILYLLFFCNLFFMQKKGLYRGFFFFIFTSFTLVPILIIIVLLAAGDIISFNLLESLIMPIIMIDFSLLNIFASSTLGIRLLSYQNQIRNSVIKEIKDTIKRK